MNNGKLKTKIWIGIWAFAILFVMCIWIWLFCFAECAKTKKLNEEIEMENLISSSEIENEIQIEEPESGHYFPISESEKEIVRIVVAGEAKGESMKGKMAVAQCIMNAMKQDGLTANEVRNEYQYLGWDTELKFNNPEAWNEVCKAVDCIFDNGEIVTDENILWFYAPQWCNSAWHESQKFVMEIGGHRFFAPWN